MNALLDGMDAAAIAACAGAPVARVFEAVESTMDEAHLLAQAGTRSGTIVVADVQSAGRGRLGRPWSSEAVGQGLWMTSVHREVARDALDCLTIRVGLRVAASLDPFADGPVAIKWPNDLLVAGRKVSGILVETHWRGMGVEWVAVGVGVNLHAPAGLPNAAALRPGVARRDVLAAVAPAVRAACECSGTLSAAELDAFAARDAFLGAAIREPAAGRAHGIDATGALRVDTDGGPRLLRNGSLVLALEDP